MELTRSTISTVFFISRPTSVPKMFGLHMQYLSQRVMFWVVSKHSPSNCACRKADKFIEYQLINLHTDLRNTDASLSCIPLYPATAGKCINYDNRPQTNPYRHRALLDGPRQRVFLKDVDWKCAGQPVPYTYFSIRQRDSSSDVRKVFTTQHTGNVLHVP